MQTIIITGQTYVHRRELRGLGALWNGEAKGYVAPLAHDHYHSQISQKMVAQRDTFSESSLVLRTECVEA